MDHAVDVISLKFLGSFSTIVASFWFSLITSERDCEKHMKGANHWSALDDADESQRKELPLNDVQVDLESRKDGIEAVEAEIEILLISVFRFSLLLLLLTIGN